jgi:hypothetical protein
VTDHGWIVDFGTRSMRFRWAMAGVLGALLGGCVTTRSPQAPPPRRAETAVAARPDADDRVVIDVAMIERPVGDFYINSRLWEAADEQMIAPERRASIEDNGLRLGLIGGTLPTELQDLLASKRTCPDPRRIQVHAMNATTLPLGPTLPECQFILHEDGKATVAKLQQADGVLRVTPTFGDGGRIRLQVVPEVMYGGTSLMPRPAADRSGWELHQHRLAETYPSAAWDVTLAPGQYLLVGGRFDRPDTFGHRLFIRPEPNPVQYLMLIRAGGLQPPGPTGAESDDGSRTIPSLARQASLGPTPARKP